METINDRIQWIIDTRFQGNKKRFATEIGISTSAVDGIVGERKSFPSFTVLRKISALGYSGDWLINGEEQEYNSQSVIGSNNIVSGSNNHLQQQGTERVSNNSQLLEQLKNYEKIIQDLSALLKTKDEQISQLIRLLDLQKQ